MFGPLSGRNNLCQLFDDGHDDTFDFPHTTPARIVGILIVALGSDPAVERGIEALERGQQIAEARPPPCDPDLYPFQV